MDWIVTFGVDDRTDLDPWLIGMAFLLSGVTVHFWCGYRRRRRARQAFGAAFSSEMGHVITAPLRVVWLLWAAALMLFMVLIALSEAGRAVMSAVEGAVPAPFRLVAFILGLYYLWMEIEWQVAVDLCFLWKVRD